MFTIQMEIPVPAASPPGYTGMAHDGVSYYFVNGRDCKVYRYGQSLAQERCFDTCRSYASICFDPKENCIWAASFRGQPVIYKLNTAFQEIDSLPLVVPDYDAAPGPVTHLFYDYDSDGLLIALGTCLVRVDCRLREEPVLLMKAEGTWIRCALYLGPYIVCCSMGGEQQMLQVFSSDGTLVETRRLSWKTDMPVSAALVPRPDRSGDRRLMLLISRRRCYSYVCICADVYEGFDGSDENLAPNEDLWDCLLSDGPEESFEQACAPCSCEEPSSCPPACERPAVCVPGACGTDILEAVALSEKAVACILNAEGNKLKKILEGSDDSSEILEANRSVQTAIVRATHLEHALYDLLSSLDSICEGSSTKAQESF